MMDSYTQTLQDQIGQLGKLLGVQNKGVLPEPPAVQSTNAYDCVDGLEGAKTFMQNRLLSGAKHIVWDTKDDIFYVLEKDSNGTPSRIKICHFTVELEPTMEDKYVTREDFAALSAKLDKLLSTKTRGEKNVDG